MNPKEEIAAIFAQAEEQAFALLERRVLEILPKGYVLHMAVGWEIVLFDPNYEDVSYQDNLPSDLQEVIDLAELFEACFGLSNQKIEGIKEPKA